MSTDPVSTERGVIDTEAIELARRIAAGDEAAEANLVDRFGRGLRYMLLRLCGDPSQADDLFQETFRVVLEKLRRGDLREPEKLSGFIRGIARNLWVGVTRKRRRRGDPAPLDAVPEPIDSSTGSLGRVLIEEDRRRVRQILGELRSARDREVLYRFYIAEEPRSVISRDLGLAERQLNVVLFRARQRFRQLLEAAGEIPDSETTLSGRPAGGRPRTARRAGTRRDEDA